MIDGGLNAYHLQYLMFGALWTIGLSLISFVGGGLAGGVIALCRISPIKPLRWATIAWIQLIQGTPLLVVLFLCYFGLSIIGFELPAIVAASIAMIVYVSAYLGEIWRGCIQSVPHTQWEAATLITNDSSAAENADTFQPRLARPKNTRNTCTSSGMLRSTST